jgi:hypothetical protein
MVSIESPVLGGGRVGTELPTRKTTSVRLFASNIDVDFLGVKIHKMIEKEKKKRTENQVKIDTGNIKSFK